MASNPPPRGTLEARLVEILETFERGVPGARGSAIADRDGLPIANGFREPYDLMAVTAMSTLTVQSSRTVFERLGLQVPVSILIEGQLGKVLVCQLGGGRASFIALVAPDANLGLLRMEMAVAARKLEEALGWAGPTGGRVEEVFLLTHSGILIGHACRAQDPVGDQDIVAGMLSAIQSFIRDVFRAKGETLEEMELAHLRVRLVRGEWCTLAVIASGRIRADYVTSARQGLLSWEDQNDAALDSWEGDADTLANVRGLLDGLLAAPSE